MQTILPELKISAVVRGSRIRMMTAAKRFGLYSALRACRAIFFRSNLQPRLTVDTMFCSCGTMPGSLELGAIGVIGVAGVAGNVMLDGNVPGVFGPVDVVLVIDFWGIAGEGNAIEFRVDELVVDEVLFVMANWPVELALLIGWLAELVVEVVFVVAEVTVAVEVAASLSESVDELVVGVVR